MIFYLLIVKFNLTFILNLSESKPKHFKCPICKKDVLDLVLDKMI